MGKLVIAANGQALSLASAKNALGTDVTLYSDATLQTGVTLPLAFRADTTLYAPDGPVTLVIKRYNGGALWTGVVLLQGAVACTLSPVPTAAQVAADVASPGFPAYATAARPDPATVAAGSAIFDTDLSKPLWSNGTSWLLATGLAPA
jgi:hypothetical protein